MVNGITRTFRGLRSGDQRTLYTGAAILAYSIWKRRKDSRRLLYRRVLKKDEALLIRAGRRDTARIIVPDDLADQVALRRRATRAAQKRNR
jgi:hypothetical protein